MPYPSTGPTPNLNPNVSPNSSPQTDPNITLTPLYDYDQVFVTDLTGGAGFRSSVADQIQAPP